MKALCDPGSLWCFQSPRTFGALPVPCVCTNAVQVWSQESVQ